MTQKEKRRHRARLRRIQQAGERRQMREELRAARAAYRKPRKPLTTSKLALAYIFGSCTVVQVYSMLAMWHFGDLSALYSLIGATVGEAISYCAYAAKSTKENTTGGITYDMAMLAQQQQQAAAPTPSDPVDDPDACG